MESVEFNEPGSNLAPKATKEAKGLSGLFIKIGLAKDEREAQIVMLILAVACIVATVFLWVFVAPERSLETPEPVSFSEYVHYL